MDTVTDNDEKLRVWNKKFHILAMKDEEKQLLRKIYGFRMYLKYQGVDSFKGRVKHPYENFAYDLAKKQIEAMQKYADILHQRILLFKKYGIE